MMRRPKDRKKIHRETKEIFLVPNIIHLVSCVVVVVEKLAGPQ